MTDGLDRALERLQARSKALAAARRDIAALEPARDQALREAKAAGASEAQLMKATGLSRVTVWKRLK